MARKSPLPVHDGDHAHSWEVPGWIDPRGAYVYVVWDAVDPENVLYIGSTGRLLARLAQHAESSLWWDRAGHLDIYLQPDRASATLREAQLINALDPECNVVIPPCVPR